MNFYQLFHYSALVIGLMFSCSESEFSDPPAGGGDIFYENLTDSNLPTSALTGLSMDAAAADFDNDGDLDLVVANEFGQNILLLNNGSGVFTNASSRLPVTARDSEDIGVADFDGNGTLDIFIVSEDDRENELYINNGEAAFSDASNRLNADGISNAIIVFDVNRDGFPDVMIGNNGQNELLVNNGQGFFTNETQQRLPGLQDATQDLELGDIDGDDDLDIVVANEDDNRILINNGNGVFEDQTSQRLPLRDSPEETRETKLGDIDGDGDFDLFFANIQGFVEGAVRQNRLLLNNGNGVFSDVTSTQLPEDNDRSFTALFSDADRDGDLDLITGNTNGSDFGGNTPYRVYLNDGDGRFEEKTEEIFPTEIAGRGFDIVPADFNGDGLLDYYFASRGSVDQLVFGIEN